MSCARAFMLAAAVWESSMASHTLHHRTGKRSVEQLAIGRRMEEPLHDFLLLLSGED
jgi:hypothetical protein